MPIDADIYDRQESAQRDLGALKQDLTGIYEQLTAVAPRREDLLQAIRQLVSTLDAFVHTGPGQPPELAFSAVAQYSALESDIDDAASDDEETAASSTGLVGGVKHVWNWIKKTLKKVGARLWSLISHLTKVKEWSVKGSVGVPLLGLGNAEISLTFGP